MKTWKNNGTMTVIIMAIIGLLALSGCGEGSGDEGSGDENKPPVATIQVHGVPVVGETIVFEVNASDPDGVIVDKQWSGDVEAGNIFEVVKVFESPGEYNITVTVTDDDGATATASKMVEIKKLPPVHVGYLGVHMALWETREYKDGKWVKTDKVCPVNIENGSAELKVFDGEYAYEENVVMYLYNKDENEYALYFCGKEGPAHYTTDDGNTYFMSLVVESDNELFIYGFTNPLLSPQFIIMDDERKVLYSR
jgi:hypothetical protein